MISINVPGGCFGLIYHEMCYCLFGEILRGTSMTTNVALLMGNCLNGLVLSVNL